MTKAIERIFEEMSKNIGETIEAIYVDIKHSEEKNKRKIEERK